MEKKNLFHYSITAINTIIAVIALYLAFSHNKQLTDIDFLWETDDAFYMPFELTKKASTFYNSESIIRIKQEPSAETDNIEYSLSIWLRMKIVNTGLRSFTVDYIGVEVSPIKSNTTYVFSRVLTKTQDKGKPANEKIELPVVIESGHSKYFLKKIEIPISRKIYFENKQTFKNINSKTLSPDENVCSILQNFNIISNITLAGGQTKSAKVKHCQGAVVAREIPYTK